MMTKIKKYTQYILNASLITLSLNTSLLAETYYVTDGLSAPYQSGASSEYRIVGNIQSGEEVEIESWSTDRKYAQFKDSKGKQVWIKSEFLTETPSAKTRIPMLEQEVTTLTAELASIEKKWQEKTADIQKRINDSDTNRTSLTDENERLKTELSIANKKLDALEIQLDEKRRDIILQWFLYGGGVALSGLILGLLMPRLIPRNRDRRWMR